MPRKKRQVARGAAVSQKEIGLINEMDTINRIDLFGWLTSYQIQEVLSPTKDGNNGLARKVIARLIKKKLISTEILSGEKRQDLYKKTKSGFSVIDRGLKKSHRKSGHHINSPTTKAKAYILTDKGVRLLNKYLKENPEIRSCHIKKTATFLDDINDNKYQFHRCLSNQFLIDCENGIFKFMQNQLGNYCFDLFLGEGALLADGFEVDKHFGTLPDAIIKDTKQNMLCCIEIENSKRGDFKHGTKLSGWLHNYLHEVSNKENNGVYCRNHKNDKPEAPFSKYSYKSHSDVFQIFVCSNEEIFRSVYRQVNITIKKLTLSDKALRLLEDRVFYFVLHETKAWANPITRVGVEFSYEATDEHKYLNEAYRFFEHFEDEAKQVAYQFKDEAQEDAMVVSKELKKDKDYSEPAPSILNRVFKRKN
jgi:hypothetical protein